MRHHDLKTHPSAFANVKAGHKRHEVRLNDRDYMTGDTVTLREWDPSVDNHVTRGYTGNELGFTIGHITQGGTWGLPPSLCVFTLLESVRPMSKPRKTPLREALMALARLLHTWDRFGPPTLMRLNGGLTTPEEARLVLKRLAPADLISPAARRVLHLGRVISPKKRKPKK